MIWMDERRRVERLQARVQRHRVRGERLRGVLKDRAIERMGHVETLAWVVAAGVLWGSRQRKVPIEEQERHPVRDLVAVGFVLARWARIPAKMTAMWRDVQARDEMLRAQRRAAEVEAEAQNEALAGRPQ